jgi:hypothetical protein
MKIRTDIPNEPEIRKSLSELERRVLLSSLICAEEEGDGRDYVVDVTMVMPAGYAECLQRALIQSEAVWPSSDGHVAAGNPVEFVDAQTKRSDIGLWSVLPSHLFRKVAQFGKSPDQSVIDVVSKIVQFSNACRGMFAVSVGSAWPDVPPLNLCVESSHCLVASQRFQSEEAGERWATLARHTFNTPEFVRELEELDEEMEIAPAQFYSINRVECGYRGWLPSKGAPTELVLLLAERLRTAESQNSYRATAQCLASLRDRGYVTLHGLLESPDTKWMFPAECVLTGTGYLRAKSLNGEL